jgi:hypothetical protein
MSYRLTADVIGADELRRAFQQAPKLTLRELSRAIGSTAASIQGKAKQYAPVDQGILRASIHTEGPHQRGNDVEAKVGTNVKYAPHQEYGTGIYGPKKRKIVPIKGKFLVFKVGAETVFARSIKGVRPKLYFKRGIDESQPHFASSMRDALTAIVKGLAA